MERSYLARLDTLRGPLFLFDSSAMKAVLETLPIVTELAGGVPLQSSLGLLPDPAFAVGVGGRLLVDGFTIDQWATYGRRKSEIASRVCKENGALKAKLASIGHSAEDVVNCLLKTEIADHKDKLFHPNMAGSGTISTNRLDEDTLVAHDPWRNAVSTTRSGTGLGDECSSFGAWSSWKPTCRDVISGDAPAHDDSVASTPNVGDAWSNGHSKNAKHTAQACLVRARADGSDSMSSSDCGARSPTTAGLDDSGELKKQNAVLTSYGEQNEAVNGHGDLEKQRLALNGAKADIDSKNKNTCETDEVVPKWAEMLMHSMEEMNDSMDTMY